MSPNPVWAGGHWSACCWTPAGGIPCRPAGLGPICSGLHRCTPSCMARLAQLMAAARLQVKKGKKIRQGAAQEEAALHQHILQMAPSQAHLQQMGHLAELLILFGRFEAAKALQAALGRLQAASAEASAWLLEHPVQGLQQQSLQARKQSAPEVQWKWHVLKDL